MIAISKWIDFESSIESVRFGLCKRMSGLTFLYLPFWRGKQCFGSSLYSIPGFDINAQVRFFIASCLEILSSSSEQEWKWSPLLSIRERFYNHNAIIAS